MSTQSQTQNNIIKIKKQIQGIVSKLMSEPQTELTEEENKLIEQISKYKVTNQKELTKLSKELTKLSKELTKLSKEFDEEFKFQAIDDSGLRAS